MDSIFRLEHFEYLYGLALIPVFVLLYFYYRYKRKKLLNLYGDYSLVNKLIPEVSKYKPWVKFSLMMIALLLIIIGISNPQIGSKVEEVKREGVDIIIALDVSNSMMSEDIKPSRLERAKQLVLRLVDKLQNDRIGIVTFAGDAFLQLPLTSDFSSAKLLINTVDTETIPTQGTAIGKAIETAVSSYPDTENKYKALIIITDGENHEDDAVNAAKEATKKGIIIHTIGMGSQQGSPIPIYNNGSLSGFMKDDQGNTVISKLDITTLEQIAASGNGRFFLSASSDPDLAQLITDISKMDKKEYSSQMFTDYESRFQYFLAAALVFLLIEFLLSEQKNKFIESLNLFGERKK